MTQRTEVSKARRLFIKASALLAGLGSIASAFRGSQAHAAAKLAKQDVQYQEQPKAGKDCDDCMHFLPGASVKAAGACNIVEGAISPRGYCLAFTPKRKVSSPKA